jgi:hypothetical protein
MGSSIQYDNTKVDMTTVGHLSRFYRLRTVKHLIAKSAKILH